MIKIYCAPIWLGIDYAVVLLSKMFSKIFFVQQECQQAAAGWSKTDLLLLNFARNYTIAAKSLRLNVRKVLTFNDSTVSVFRWTEF